MEVKRRVGGGGGQTGSRRGRATLRAVALFRTGATGSDRLGGALAPTLLELSVHTHTGPVREFHKAPQIAPKSWRRAAAASADHDYDDSDAMIQQQALLLPLPLLLLLLLLLL